MTSVTKWMYGKQQIIAHTVTLRHFTFYKASSEAVFYFVEIFVTEQSF